MSVFFYKNNALIINAESITDGSLNIEVKNMTLESSRAYTVRPGNTKQVNVERDLYISPGVYRASAAGEEFYFIVRGTYNIEIKQKIQNERMVVSVKSGIDLTQGKLYFRLNNVPFNFEFPEIKKNEEKFFVFKYPGKDAEIRYCFKSTVIPEKEMTDNEHGLVNILVRRV